MEYWLSFARGPLFVMTFLFMTLAMLRLVVIHIMAIRGVWGKTRDHNLNPGEPLKAILEWIFPAAHVPRSRALFSLISFLWHIGLILVPVFFVSHVLLWERGLGAHFPDFIKMEKHTADILTIVTICLTAALFVLRAAGRESRALSEPIDYLLLVLLSIPFITGFLAVHSGLNPIPYDVTMLIHILSAEAVFVLMPLTKLAHVALFPFGRASTYIYWRFPEGSGDIIASELFGEEAKL